MGKRAILVVDDEAPVRATLMRFIRSLNVVEEVLEAADGQAAVDLVSNHSHIKLVFLDLKMPGMDGLTVLEKIRKINPTLKVAILTGYPFYGEAEALVPRFGVLDFMTKPVDLDYLEQIISAALSSEEGPPPPSSGASP